jgi:very-short-patch-repair endonuclease
VSEVRPYHPGVRHRIDRLSFGRVPQAQAARELRRSLTPAERHAWSLLRKRGIHGLKFRRQHVLGRFVVDFYCPEHRLVLEVEGAPHLGPAQAAYDAARAAQLERLGYTVVRVGNRDLSPSHLEELLRPYA